MATACDPLLSSRQEALTNILVACTQGLQVQAPGLGRNQPAGVRACMAFWSQAGALITAGEACMAAHLKQGGPTCGHGRLHRDEA